MSVKGVFTKGRPSAASSPQTTSIVRYLPRPRNPARPYLFGRENLDPADLDKHWGFGRYHYSLSNHRSPYYAGGNTFKMEEEVVPQMPRKQLEKFMPNIGIGSAAYVTPVSVMSARSGHRVTHDMLHSYDPFVAKVQGVARVDHDNVSVQDPGRVGLHPDTVGSRARIFRWLRRSPFFQEGHYFNRSAVHPHTGQPVVAAVEAPLHDKIIRLAQQGHLKAACEEYRRLAFVPPVEVYRALTRACIPGAKLADAVELFEEGNARLRYVARDLDVVRNVLRCAIAADSPERVMWLVNKVQGTFTENNIVAVRFSRLERYDIYSAALEFLLDRGADELAASGCSTTAERAQELYALMARQGMLYCDLQMAEGQRLQKLLMQPSQEKVTAPTSAALSAHPLQGAARSALDIVAGRWLKADVAPEQRDAWFGGGAAEAAAGESLQKAVAALTATDDALRVDMLFLMRHCRFRGKTDLLAGGSGADGREQFQTRALLWLAQLSPAFGAFNAAAAAAASAADSLPYLPKSRPSHAINDGEFSRVAIPPAQVRSYSGGRANSGNNNVARFYYKPGVRFVAESWPTLDSDRGEGRYLVRVPVHTELFAAATAPAPVLLHSSVSPDAAGSNALLGSNNALGSASGSKPAESAVAAAGGGVAGGGAGTTAVKVDPSMEGAF